MAGENKQTQYSFFLDTSDLTELHIRAKSMGISNTSSLMRFLVKQFLANGTTPNLQDQNQRRYL